MLQFILGKSGTGKTKYIYNQINKLISGGEQKIIMLVPDQITFETEKALLEILGARLSLNVNVFGFSGLCRHVFELASKLPGNVVDNGTRAMIMSIALEQLDDKLTLLKSKHNKSLTNLMLGTLKECKKSGVTTDMLRFAAQNVDDNTLQTKLNETALIFDSFDAILSQSYIDPYDDLDRLYNILLENINLFRDYTLFIDSFSGFTVQQLNVLKILFTRCSKNYVSLTLDPEVPDNEYIDDAFATTRKTYKTLRAMAKAEFVGIKTPVKLTECKRFLSPELADMESRLFRAGNILPPCDYPPENVTVYEASDVCNECEFAARQIKHLIIEHGYHYSEISVVCRETKPYNGILNAIFEKYEIPYFMDERKDVEVKPVIRFVNSVFRIILDNFEQDDVLTLLKSGLTEVPPSKVSDFENYIYTWNINNSDFKKPFTQNPHGFSDSLSGKEKNQLNSLEKVRLSIIEPLLKFKSDIKDKNGREITAMLYELLIGLKVDTALKKLCDTAERISDKKFGEEQVRIWKLLMDAFDKTVAVAGDMPLSARRYFELLSIQIAAIDFSEIPRTIDSVTVTNAQRVRSSRQRAVFLIGCTEGNFPQTPEPRGLFSPFELQLLSLNKVEITENASDSASLEAFMAYTCMTSPSEKLFVSYYTVNLSGELFEPSEIVTGLVRRVFPKICVLTSSDFEGSYEESMLAVQPAFEAYAKSLSKGRAELSGLREYFENDPVYSAKSLAVLRAIDKSQFQIHQPENSRLLFGSELHITASKIEEFNKCPFRYFCRYGLRVDERRKADIDAGERGTFIHHILERFFSTYDKQAYSAMTDAQIKAFIEKTCADYLNTYFGGKEQRSASFLFKMEYLSNNAFYVVKHIIEELSQSKFDVECCELNISDDIPEYKLTLSGGQTVSIRGFVDRVDIMEENGERFLRVIDYKTNERKTFNLRDILYGVNLQMLVYLHSIEKVGTQKFGEFTPAGILYSPALVSAVASGSADHKAIDSKLNSKLKSNGLILDDDSVIQGMEQSGAGKYIPVKLKRGADDKSCVSAEEFAEIFEQLDIKIIDMGERLLGGKIEAVPLKGDGIDGCEFCPYDSVCAYRHSKETEVLKLDKKEDIIKAINDNIKKEKGGDE